MADLAVPPERSSLVPTTGKGVVDEARRSHEASPFGTQQPVDASHLPPGIEEKIERLRYRRGFWLCIRSPVVCVKAATEVALASLVVGLAVVWYCLHEVPTFVLSAHQGLALSLVGAVFTLALVGGLAGYVTTRLYHPRSIRRRGKVAASGVGPVLGCIVAGGLLSASSPWSFPVAKVNAVPPLVAASYLTRGEVSGGAILYENALTIACLQTRAGWIDTTVPPGATQAVIDHIPFSGLMTPGRVLQEIADIQAKSLNIVTRRLWLFNGLLIIEIAVVTPLQRHKWTSKPWPAPGPRDIAETIQWALASES